MIYVTGDCHSEFNRLSAKNFPDQKALTRDDYVIICGDFGGVWDYEKESRQEKYWLDWLEEKKFTILFVDGNHENFDRLNSYETEEWHGGKIHRIRENIIHLMRGQVYEINGKTFFTFGGASSHDIKDGILNLDEKDKIYRYRKQHLQFRIRNYTWWAEELPSMDEIKEANDNLEKVRFNIDYVITHCAPTSIQKLIDKSFKPDILTDYFEDLKEKLKFSKWYFGHYHEDKVLDDRFELLYENIKSID